MRPLNPTTWAIAAWVFFVMLCSTPLSAPTWYPTTAMTGMGLSALVSLVTGIVQRRRNPGASRASHYLLAGLLLIIAVTFFLLPAL